MTNTKTNIRRQQRQQQSQGFIQGRFVVSSRCTSPVEDLK